MAGKGCYCYVNGVLEDGIRQEALKHGRNLFSGLPHDASAYRCDCSGEPSAKLPDSDPMKIARISILQTIGP